MTTTKVLIDGRSLWDASSYRGIGVYLRSLLPYLAADPDLSVRVLATDDVVLPDGVHRARISRRMPGRFATREHELRLPLDARRFPHDVFHSPALSPLARSRRPWVQTLHDVIPLAFEHPEFAAERKQWIQRIGPAVARADAVIAGSQHTADDAARLLAIDPNRIFVAPYGVDPRFTPTKDRSFPDPPYVLHMGEFDPRKGHSEAFEVVARLADAGLPHRLKVAGRIVPWTEPQIRALVAASPRPDRVDLLGYVDDELMPGLYSGASALLVTSRYEGFGLPALEAMATGTPVVAFSNSSITEVVADGGILIRDGDVEAFANEIISLLRSEDRWATVSERGIERARLFTWARSAEVHAYAYDAALRVGARG
jgi:alpha-1,3-rhamnosyl/mannosyltransferase